MVVVEPRRGVVETCRGREPAAAHPREEREVSEGREGEAALGLSVNVEGEGGMSLPSWLGLRVEEREGRGTVSLGA